MLTPTDKGLGSVSYSQALGLLGRSPTLWSPPLLPHLSHCLEYGHLRHACRCSRPPGLQGCGVSEISTTWHKLSMSTPSPRCVSGCPPLTPPSEGLVPLLFMKAGTSSEFLTSSLSTSSPSASYEFSSLFPWILPSLSCILPSAYPFQHKSSHNVPSTL